MIEILGALIFGYLVGSIPTAYIIARFLKGIDIRKVGSGNVGGSNVAVQVGKFPAAAVLLFDIVKGALAIAILRGSGVSDAAQMAAGIAAIIGHSWPVWLRFVGGRGISTTGGVLFMFGPLETIVTGIVLGLGSVLHAGAVTTVAVFALWPLAAWWLGRPDYVIVGSIIIWLIIVARRLQGSPGVTHRVPGENVLWNRFWLDRDIRDEEEWVKQKGTKTG
jgi:acyl phosphate:glycerol-3-phosphate acyltransferase